MRRFTLATMRSRAFLISGCCLGLLAACAPDAIIPSKPYDAFLDQISKACRGKAIGAWTVDQLVRRSHGFKGGYFVDQTSRLYFGRINTHDWAAGVTAFLNGWDSDPGVACVIREYREVQEWSTPTGKPAGPGQPFNELPGEEVPLL
jgi:hypothetical protein